MIFLLILFIVVPIVEIYVIIQVGQAIGVLPTVALLLADAVLGSALLRQQGRGAWLRFNEAIAAHRFPAREVADGLMIAVGATLLLSPGFVTDIFGLLFLLPPTRAVLRRLFGGLVAKRFLVVNVGSRAYQRASGSWPGQGPGETPGSRPSARSDYDFDGEAEEIDPDDPRLPPPDERPS